MTVYVIAQLRIKDRAEYNRYQSRFMGVFSRFEGRLLAADEQPQVLEGDWSGDKIVLMSFPDQAACRAWGGSAAYRSIAVHRKAGADAVILQAHGIGGSRIRLDPHE